MEINQVSIVDTFAEAFAMRFTRIVVTAVDDYWLDIALNEMCGYGTSVIACDAEIGVENRLDANTTPDGRPGAAVLAFAFNEESLGKAMVNRCGQCLMTCPTTAVYAGWESEKTLPLGSHLRFFGDGYQRSKLIGDRRYWRIPVMDGEFLIEENTGWGKGVAGGNFLIQSASQPQGLNAARKAVQAIAKVPGVITPFPGGVVRSGSKVGSRYKGLVASTSHVFCPTLRGRVESEIHDDANCVYEIVIDGIDVESVELAMVTGIQSITEMEVIAISAGNYGGKLGKYRFDLHQLLANCKKF